MVMDKSKKDKQIKKQLRKELLNYLADFECMKEVPISLIGKFTEYCVNEFEYECFGIPYNVLMFDLVDELFTYVEDCFFSLKDTFFTEYYENVKSNFNDYIDKKLYLVLYGEV